MNFGSNSGKFGEEGDGVVESWFPVVGLVDAFLVRFRKDTCMVECRDSTSELSHWMQVLGEIVQHVLHKFWQSGFLSELTGKGADLRGRGDLACEEQPEHGFREHFGASSAFGEDTLALGYGFAMEPDAFVGVKDGALPNHCLEAPLVMTIRSEPIQVD